jgi:hypothetical protein
VCTNKRNKKKPPPIRQVPIVRGSSCYITVKKLPKERPAKSRATRARSVFT